MMKSFDVYAFLRAEILVGGYLPGQRISESKLAEQLGLSRQPVREAFIQLGFEGVLEAKPKAGTYVLKISKNEVHAARFLREAFEVEVVKILCETPVPGLKTELMRNLSKQAAAIKGDAESFFTLDEEFHTTLAEAAGKSRSWDMLRLAKTQLDRVRFLASEIHQPELVVEQHSRIVEAIEEGNRRKAASRMRRHLRRVVDYLPHIQSKYEEYFVE